MHGPVIWQVRPAKADSASGHGCKVSPLNRRLESPLSVFMLRYSLLPATSAQRRPFCDWRTHFLSIVREKEKESEILDIKTDGVIPSSLQRYIA